MFIMIAARFGHCGYTTAIVMTLPKRIQLRDIQQDICSLFRQSFPKKMAKVKVYDKMYDDFADYPFEDVIGEVIECTITFVDSKDPYFYDVIDRQYLKYTIEQELRWEKEKANGETCLTLREWLTPYVQLPMNLPSFDDM